MAYYDRFVDKKKDPRDDWRDDEKTRRPQRDLKGEEPKRSYRAVRGPKRQDGQKGKDQGFGTNHGQSSNGEHGRGYQNEHHGQGYQDSHHGQGKGANYSHSTREHEHGKDNGYEHSYDSFHDGERDHEMENLLVGRNPIREALKSGRDMEKLLIARGELMGSAKEIIAMARDQHVVIQEVDRIRLDQMAPNHQGMVAVVSAYEYKTVDDIFALAAEKEEEPFIILLDGITDPHNLGAIIRSAECAGAHGVIIPTRRAAGLTPTAVKASAGAVEHIPVAREVNLTRTIERLKKEGVWVFGSAMSGKNYRNADYSGPVALVIGSEGEGISKLVAEHCDDMISIPMRGKIGSLNASVAAGVLMFAIADKRGGR